MSETYQPVFLIGAARSGTKILRDVIAQHPQVDKVPFDINYVWRLGNENLPDDEIPAASLTPEIQSKIAKNIERFHKGAPVLIEKTVSNCLRVPFVHAAFPQAKYIHLIRHGEDVVESVYRQWKTPPDWRYILDKARTYPLLESPGYALRYIKDTVSRLFQKQSHSPVLWGPAYRGIQQDTQTLDLWQVCALQWAHSVDKAFQGLNMIDPEKVLLIRYENFVQEPLVWLDKVANFLGVDNKIYNQSEILTLITAKNIGKAQNNLSSEQKNMIRPYLETMMMRCHYTFYPQL